MAEGVEFLGGDPRCGKLPLEGLAPGVLRSQFPFEPLLLAARLMQLPLDRFPLGPIRLGALGLLSFQFGAALLERLLLLPERLQERLVVLRRLLRDLLPLGPSGVQVGAALLEAFGFLGELRSPLVDIVAGGFGGMASAGRFPGQLVEILEQSVVDFIKLALLRREKLPHSVALLAQGHIEQVDRVGSIGS